MNTRILAILCGASLFVPATSLLAAGAVVPDDAAGGCKVELVPGNW